MSATQASIEPNASLTIEARGLVRRFGHFVAVDHVDVTVGRGEVFGLLGANGAGKTTTIRMLCGTLTPTAGEVRVGGVDMVRHARRARGRIGYVAQRFALYADLSVVENLRLQAGLYGLVNKRRRQRLDWALQHLDLADTAQTLAGALPLGYQRRLALAAALLHEPEVLFLDEPTSGMDPLARQQFWELVYDLAEAGIGILVTTHYMDEAAFCDRLALMDAGRIVEHGAPEELLTRPLATPILDLRAPDCAHCARLLRDWPEVREIVPHAGHLRVRLRADVDAAATMERIRAAAREQGAAIEALEPAQPDLEDVFVAVLEHATGEIDR
jgi:ABC-2 type transport system ATP-binding protein